MVRSGPDDLYLKFARYEIVEQKGGIPFSLNVGGYIKLPTGILDERDMQQERLTKLIASLVLSRGVTTNLTIHQPI